MKDPRWGVHVLDWALHERELKRYKPTIDLEAERRKSVEFLSDRFKCDAAGFLDEYRHSPFLAEYEACCAELVRLAGGLQATSDRFDCETLYLTVRAARPRIVVETGVLFGAFTAHFLEALDRNGEGRLISLDLPSPPGRPPKDTLVPPRLRGRAELVLGDTKDTLMGVLERTGPIDLFNHDSLHYFHHMTWEYLVAHRWLRPGGVLTSHDVLSTRLHPNAFPVFTNALGYDNTIVRNYGIAIKPDQP